MLKIIDSTLRDGNHAVRHQLDTRTVREYAGFAEKAGLDVLIVGHGNGLGASSLHLGEARLSDKEMVKTARKELSRTKLGAFLIPGFGAIRRDLEPIIDQIDVLQVASHCSEANITRQHIEYAKKKRKIVYGVLMMTHMLQPTELTQQADLMREYGADGILYMDSAGALLPNEVKDRQPQGFHPHNNLGLAVANGVAAVESGAKILDLTTRGLGAGAGNCPLEVLIPVLHKMGYKTHVNQDLLLGMAEYIRKKYPPQEISPLSITSGLSGIFSGFKPLIEKAAKQYKVDEKRIAKELGRRKIVAGQEDQIIAVAKELKVEPIEALI